jgi:hypothetical protein
MELGQAGGVTVGGIITAPIGFNNADYLPCQGQVVSRATYADLAAKISAQIIGWAKINLQNNWADYGNFATGRIIKKSGYYYCAIVNTSSPYGLWYAKLDLFFNVIWMRSTQQTMSASATPDMVFGGGTRVLVMGKVASSGTAGSYSDDDFITRTTISGISNFAGFSITYNSANGYYAGDHATTTSLNTSADGATFAVQTMPVARTSRTFVINGLFINQVSTTQYQTSANGATGSWTTRSFPVTVAGASVLWKCGNRLYVQIGTGVRYTTDGINWSGLLSFTFSGTVSAMARIGNYDTMYCGANDYMGAHCVKYADDTVSTKWYPSTSFGAGNYFNNSTCLVDENGGYSSFDNNIVFESNTYTSMFNKAVQITEDVDNSTQIVLPLIRNSYIKIK